MNFNSLLFLLPFFFLLGSCGVKGPPLLPPNTHLKSWEEEYKKEPDVVSFREKFDNYWERTNFSKTNVLNIIEKIVTEKNMQNEIISQRILIQNELLKLSAKKNSNQNKENEIRLKEELLELNKKNEEISFDITNLCKQGVQFNKDYLKNRNSLMKAYNSWKNAKKEREIKGRAIIKKTSKATTLLETPDVKIARFKKEIEIQYRKASEELKQCNK